METSYFFLNRRVNLMSNEMRYGLKDLSIGGSLDLKLLIAYL